MISIFNGRERRLGKTTDRIFAQFDVAFRRYVHLFKNARLHVFLEIALHSDEWGFSWPSAATICKHTGYGEDTVWYAIRDLEALTLDGARVLQRYAARAPGNRVANNVYLVFPTDAELARYADATFALVDDPSRGRTLRITLRPEATCPPDFPYSANPNSELPAPETPGSALPGSAEPSAGLPPPAEPSPASRRPDLPTTKQMPPGGQRAKAQPAEPRTPTKTTTTAASSPTEATPLGWSPNEASGTRAGSGPATTTLPASAPPAGDGRAAALATFAEANNRPPNAIESRALDRLAARWDGAGRELAGWSAIDAAIVEAVESGSAYVAVRRIEAICDRWLAEPAQVVAVQGIAVQRTTQSAPTGERLGTDSLEQIWQQVLEHVRPQVSRSATQTWLAEISLVGRQGDRLIAEVGDASLADWIAGRYGPLLERAASAVIGEAVRVELRGAVRTTEEAGQA